MIKVSKKNMKVEEYNYHLPNHLIAQTPIKNRSSSKLLTLDRNTGNITHCRFKDIIDYFNPGDVLVINNTKVIPARLIGEKKETKAKIEILLLNNIKEDVWECLAKPVKRLKKDTIISFGNDLLQAKVIEIKDEGLILIEFFYTGIFNELLDKLGNVPLPPYITETLGDKSRYQTVYATNSGSAAAPTAGLHFTKNLLKQLTDKGVIITEVTLHVGLGTFRPVNVEDIKNHKMHSEFYIMEEKTANILNNAKYNSNKIYAVGTTSIRTLETVLTNHNEFISCSGYTDIFIYPGYKFKAIDGIITNFHLPKSTLLMLVSAFAGKDLIFKSYQEAIKNEYRFFSFGDAMFIK